MSNNNQRSISSYPPRGIVKIILLFHLNNSREENQIRLKTIKRLLNCINGNNCTVKTTLKLDVNPRSEFPSTNDIQQTKKRSSKRAQLSSRSQQTDRWTFINMRFTYEIGHKPTSQSVSHSQLQLQISTLQSLHLNWSRIEKNSPHIGRARTAEFLISRPVH